MAAHGQLTNFNDEEPQEEQDQPTPSYEDNLAGKLEEGFGQEQQISLQATLAIIFGASTHALEIRSSLNLLRGEIDINKLINDPGYKAEFERAVQLTNRYGRVVKKGDLVDIVPRVETALARVEILHEQTGKVKKDLSPQYEIEMRQAYGLSDEQLKTVREKALERIAENPKLSMRDALRMEAREALVKTVEAEVKSDKSITGNKRKEELEKRLDIKDKAFLEHPQTAKIHDIEKEFCEGINNRGIEAIRDTLGREIQPTPSQPVPVASAPLPIPTPPTIPPPTTSAWPVISSVPIPGSYSLRNVPLPTLGGFKTGLNILGSGFGKLLGGMGKFIGRRGLGRFINLAANLGKRAINRALDALLPGLGMTVGKINDVIKSITGIDVEKTILVGAAILVGAVASVAIILPIIIGVGVFSYITGNNPLRLSYSNGKTIGWNEFNKQYLTVNNGALSLDFSPVERDRNDKEITWQQFEKENLTLKKQFLSLEKLIQ